MSLTPVSLLDRLQRRPLSEDWKRFVDLYKPFVERFIRPSPELSPADVDDICQNVMTKLVKYLPQFRRERDGSFRTWLKTITVNEVSYHWRKTIRTRKVGRAQESEFWNAVGDPKDELNRRWESEYSSYVLRRLQELIEPEFSPTTWRAFCLRVHDEKRSDEVAAILGISTNAVDIAKSRVLARLRAEAAGLIDGD